MTKEIKRIKEINKETQALTEHIKALETEQVELREKIAIDLEELGYVVVKPNQKINFDGFHRGIF